MHTSFELSTRLNRDPIGPAHPGWENDPKIEAGLREQWIRDGIVIMPGVLSAQQIQAYNAIVEAGRLSVDDQKDPYGYGDRVGQLHQRFPDLISAAAQAPIVEFLTWAFGEEPVLFGSLNFDRGTTQEAHIDAIFFYPEPSYAMAGVWIALEDIHIDAGPLFYLKGSHRWNFNRGEDIVATRPDLAARRAAAAAGHLSPQEHGEVIRDLGYAWTEDLLALEKERGAEREKIVVKAGDMIAWHSLLAHGGSPRLNLALRRKSVVFHFLGSTSKLYTFEQFMLHDREALADITPTTMPMGEYNGLRYMKFPNVTSYVDGQEKVHDV
jgi:Phytanoyl-CoA dioxygenase (PhyH)